MEQCHCLTLHAVTEEDRERSRKALRDARLSFDPVGIMLAIEALTGWCPAKVTNAIKAG